MPMMRSRPQTVPEFSLWLRDAIEQVEQIRACPEWDLSTYEYCSRIVLHAERHARFVGGQELCCLCRKQTTWGPVETLDVLGKCLAWCAANAGSSVSPEQGGPELFPNGKPFMFEDELTEFLNLRPTTLRDARLRGEITAAKMGRRYQYTPQDVRDWTAKTREKG